MKMTKNGTAVIGIDHGYGNIKTANTITPTGVTAYETKPAFEGNILFYDNTYYKIGDVHKTYIPDKSEDMDNYICTLYGIARELSREGQVFCWHRSGNLFIPAREGISFFYRITRFGNR